MRIRSSALFGRVPGSSCLALLLLVSACDNPFDSDGDRSAPRVTLSSPSTGSTVDTDSVVVEGVAEGNRVVARVSYRLNGGPEEPVQVQPARSVSFRVVVRGLKLGTNEVEVLAYDAAEKVGTLKVALSTHDSLAPTVEVSSPADQELVGRDSVRVTGTLGDNWKVTALSYALDGGAEQSVPITAGREASFGFTLNPSPGEHRLVLRARDEAGNVEERTVRFTTATAGLSVTTPGPGATLDAFVVIVQGTTDSSVPVAKMTYSINGAPERVMCFLHSVHYPQECARSAAGQHTYRWTVDGLPQGNVHLQVFAYDAEQRKIGAAEVKFRVAVPTRLYRIAGRIGSGTTFNVKDLNDRNEVVGHFYDGASSNGKIFFWDGSRRTDLSMPDFYTPGRLRLNDRGDVAGTRTLAGAFLWRPRDGSLREIAPYPAHAQDINSRGEVLLRIRDRAPEGFIWRQDSLVPLQISGSGFLVPEYMDSAGVAVGREYLYDSTPSRLVFLRTDAPLEPLAFTGDVSGMMVRGMNDRRHVLFSSQLYRNGVSSYPRNLGRGFVLEDLNDRDQVVGNFDWRRESGYHAEHRPMLWEDGATYSLESSDPEVEILSVSRINNSGMITGTIRDRSTGEKAAVLLGPVR